MARVLADYKGKYEEFSKAMKKSRETFKVYEGEIKNMNQRAQQLSQNKKQLLGGGKGGKSKVLEQKIENREALITKMQQDWEREKEMLIKEREELMLLCKESQEKIKVIKESSV